VAEILLEVDAVSAAYGNILALQDVSLKVPQGAIVALLGANGAGKSTTLNVISRLVSPTAGSVRFAGEPIHRLSADAVVGRGIVQVPEGREIFREMSVRENLEMGAYLRRDRNAVRQDMDMVCDTFPRLRERFEQ
jgi:branched-chain amino acid transport system ATP-binding protein